MTRQSVRLFSSVPIVSGICAHETLEIEKEDITNQGQSLQSKHGEKKKEKVGGPVFNIHGQLICIETYFDSGKLEGVGGSTSPALNSRETRGPGLAQLLILYTMCSDSMIIRPEWGN